MWDMNRSYFLEESIWKLNFTRILIPDQNFEGFYVKEEKKQKMLNFAGANVAFCIPGSPKSTIDKVMFLHAMPIRIFILKFGCFYDKRILISIKIFEEFQDHFNLLFEKVDVYQETRRTSSSILLEKSSWPLNSSIYLIKILN